MKQRISSLLTELQTQVQLMWAPRGQADMRQRAIQWLREKQSTSRVQQSRDEAQQPPSQTNQHEGGPGAKPRKWERRGRGRQAQDTLTKLLQTDATSQKYAEQLHWKFTKYYLPAKRLDIQRRRGLATDAEQRDDGAGSEHE